MALAHTEVELTTSYCSLRPIGDMAAMGEGLMVIIMGEGLMLIIMGEGLMLIIPPCIMGNNIEETRPCNRTAVPVTCRTLVQKQAFGDAECPCRRQVQFAGAPKQPQGMSHHHLMQLAPHGGHRRHLGRAHAHSSHL